MPIRDLLQAQIEQMGQAIGKMISKFLGLKNDGKIEDAMSLTQSTMQEELGLDFEKLWKADQEDFFLFFKDKPYSSESLELLSTYFYEVGLYKKTTNPADAQVILQKAIELLSLADQAENSLSMERMNKKQNIEKLLSDGRCTKSIGGDHSNRL